MALRTKTVDASGLAACHGSAVAKRDLAIEKAEADYEATRQAVIDLGTQRVAEIAILQAELAKEKQALSDTLVAVQS